MWMTTPVFGVVAMAFRAVLNYPVSLFVCSSPPPCSHRLTLFIFIAQGVRPHDALKKSLLYFSPAPTINSSPPLLVPNWIHVYYPTSTSTSRRTQAAAIAHLFLEDLSADSINTVSHWVDSNPSSICQITVPKRIISKLPSPADVRDTIYVCDGGLDYSLPAAHPHSVSRVIYSVVKNCFLTSFVLHRSQINRE
jgi:hypothetical protein